MYLKTSIKFFSCVALTFALYGCGGSSSNTSPTTPEPTPNIAPQVNAGIDQVIVVPTQVNLSATASDQDGSISSQQWTQAAGPEVILTSSSELATQFTAPDVQQVTSLEFQVTVTDNQGEQASDTVTVTVVPSGNTLISSLTFSDNNLTACVGDNAAQNGWLTVLDVTTLACPSNELTNLSGINQFSELQILNLSNNQISNIQPVSELLLLTQLNLSNNSLEKLQPLFTLNKLTTLDLTGNNDIVCVNLSVLAQELNDTTVINPEQCTRPDTEQWVYQTQAPITSTAAIAQDGTLYIGSDDNHLYAITANGSLKWSFPTQGSIKSSPAITADGTIIIGSEDHKLYAINPDGSLQWSFTTDGNIQSSAAIAEDGTIYIGSEDMNLYALDPQGNQKWSFATTGKIITSPAIGKDGTVYLVSDAQQLYAIDSQGSLKWLFASEEKITSPVTLASDRTLYFSSEDKNLYALNPDGTEKWRFATNDKIYSSVSIGDENTVYFGSDDGNLYAVQPDGMQKWSFATQAAIRSTPAISADGTILVGSLDNKLYAVSPNGNLQWTHLTGESIVSSPAIATDGTVYIGSNDRHLHAITATGGALANTPWPRLGHDNRHTGNTGKTANTARYQVTFETFWTPQTFATNFPNNPHFSGLVGGTHNESIELWSLDGFATNGIQAMAERGSVTPLLEEVAQFINEGSAQAELLGGGLGGSTTQTVLEFEVSIAYSKVTLVSMVAPSPDWFVGVNGLDLLDEGSWLETSVIPLKVYDAGTDNGLQFASANSPSAPKVPITELTSEPEDTDFSQGVHRDNPALTIGSFTFTRID